MGFTSVEKPHILALYKVACRIAKAIKLHRLAEEVIKPRVVDMVTCTNTIYQMLQGVQK